MDIHHKFNFDNPEDSYWNENSAADERSARFGRQSSTASSSFFDDGDFVDAAAAAANVFGTAELTRTLPPTTASGATDAPAACGSDATNKWIDVSFNDVQSLSDKSSAFDGSQKEEFEGTSRAFAAVGNAASIISDCSVGSRSSELTVHLDYARLKSEHKKLQKHFENIRKDRFKALPVADAVKRLQRCQPVSLDLYRTKEEKMTLLEAAINSLDHDVISAVVLFLKNTLCNSIFRQILITCPEAADHYVLHLKESNNTAELMDTLFALGRIEDAAMVEFAEACRIRQPELKLQALRKCLVSGFSVPALENELRFVKEYIVTFE